MNIKSITTTAVTVLVTLALYDVGKKYVVQSIELYDKVTIKRKALIEDNMEINDLCYREADRAAILESGAKTASNKIYHEKYIEVDRACRERHEARISTNRAIGASIREDEDTLVYKVGKLFR
ncbi:hypothetical protein AB4562_06830 [Vibrio sp. 10N.222.54.A1]|uniref:hypothetical protein n=1 Tax=unclassified Vibrio TaxID=2614977 RepID=UPI0035508D0D